MGLHLLLCFAELPLNLYNYYDQNAPGIMTLQLNLNGNQFCLAFTEMKAINEMNRAKFLKTVPVPKRHRSSASALYRKVGVECVNGL